MNQDFLCRWTSGTRVAAGLVMLGGWLAPAFSHEGMWMPQQLPQLGEQLKQAGLVLDPSALMQPTGFPIDTMVSLGGCSASLVSPYGLIVTNHHCAYGSIQYNSTVERNLLTSGFVARSRSQELPSAPGTRAYVTVDVQDVTSRILDARTAKLSGRERSAAIEASQKAVVAECERNAGYRCTLAGSYGDAEFHLAKSLELRDVRLVYAPPEGVGKFGGDTDNWRWPRHTGDFAFYRAYVGRDGKPADFNADNVPYRPQHHLKLAAREAREGDFVMAAGYPARTSRLRLPEEVHFAFSWHYPMMIKAAREQLEIIDRETRGREAAGISYAGAVAAINNGYKYLQGLVAGYEAAPFLQEKEREARELKAWIEADAGRRDRFAADIAVLGRLFARRETTVRQEFLLSYATPRLLESACVLFELAQQRAKIRDAHRKSGYQARDWPMIGESLQAIDRRYDEQVDKALVRHFLTQYLSLPSQERDAEFLSALGLEADMSPRQIEARLGQLYSTSRLSDPKERLAWLTRDVAQFNVSDDAFIRAAVALYARGNLKDERDRALAGDIQRAYGTYMQALISYRQSHGQPTYPDANGTLRFTFGHVRGRVPGSTDGTTWSAFTTLEGILAKHTGHGEFNAPRVQLESIRQRSFGGYQDASLGSVPVNFLATLDITGGNSGSAVLNDRGELVGLVFDGTLDSVISDWNFNAAMTRAIVVDLRYVLWYLAIVDEAQELLAELKEQKSS